ncbi:cupin domain-containing protein [Streptomyces sp. NPDC057002]|uniref:cupin domain-containing protein n=1 Tax=Streptomyces sp. NPDC057002 TaxID=3345992 RepID=UPI0036310CCF
MSYSDPRYLSDRGEISAKYRPAPDEPDTGFIGASSISYVATPDTADGEYGLYKVDMGPQTMGAQEHFHRTISESFYVLSGEVQFYNGERWTKGGPGDFLYVPAGGLHAFQNDADEPLSMLMIFSPGAPREEYFEKAAEYAERNREELKAFQARHDTYFTDMPDD